MEAADLRWRIMHARYRRGRRQNYAEEPDKIMGKKQTRKKEEAVEL
jgi:hypothetical protein